MFEEGEEEEEEQLDEKKLAEAKRKAFGGLIRRRLENSKMISTRIVNNRKVHSCEKCGLEFTSTNSVVRHQEKSCLRVKVISLEKSSKNDNTNNELVSGMVNGGKKKCPICSSVFFNTHRLSIHIFKHHRNLLGSAHQPPTREARRLYEKQLAKTKAGSSSSSSSSATARRLFEEKQPSGRGKGTEKARKNQQSNDDDEMSHEEDDEQEEENQYVKINVFIYILDVFYPLKLKKLDSLPNKKVFCLFCLKG